MSAEKCDAQTATGLITVKSAVGHRSVVQLYLVGEEPARLIPGRSDPIRSCFADRPECTVVRGVVDGISDRAIWLPLVACSKFRI
jgi:hypothetical protein